MEPTANARAVAALSAEIVANIRKLSALARADSEMASTVTVLEALEAADGPIGALGDLFTDTAGWLVDFEDDDAETAADRLEETSGHTESVRENIDYALRLIRPLAG